MYFMLRLQLFMIPGVTMQSNWPKIGRCAISW